MIFLRHKGSLASAIAYPGRTGLTGLSPGRLGAGLRIIVCSVLPGARRLTIGSLPGACIGAGLRSDI